MIDAMYVDDIIYWRHKVYPMAFFRQWSIAHIEQHIRCGNFYKLYRISNKQNPNTNE